jgi:predicted nucleic acid-binding Zn ribbon protein
MKRTNAEPVGEILHDFYKENPQLKQKILEVRIRRAWDEVLGPMIMRSTQKIFIKNRVLHVSLTSSVLRNELFLNRKRLLKNLNDYVGEEVIEDIVIR